MDNTIYDPISLKVSDVLSGVLNGEIGLPDLQRPFVWANNKVPKLLDSMVKGFPVGYIMLWDSPAEGSAKATQIGGNAKDYKAPKRLVIDGQQRLTALLSSVYGVDVRDKNYNTRRIIISYDPLARSLKNADASTKRDPRYVYDISDFFNAESPSKFRRAFIELLDESNAKKGEPACDEDEVEEGLNALKDILSFKIPVLDIKVNADEETVSEIFVRVNSGGQTLKQDDFIMTLLSVYEPEMRSRIEKFCEGSHKPAKGTSFNPLIELTPGLVIRAAVGVGFKRGRLRYAYQILRGRDLKTQETTPETRAANFQTFGAALDQVLDLNSWHAFVNTLAEAGYVCPDQVSSANAVAFCYAFYLIGKNEFKMKPLAVRRLAKRWYFTSALTGLYAGSFETEFERQLTDISKLSGPEEYEAYFDRAIASTMTDDYFAISLPAALDANEATGPKWQGFTAAQVILGAKALFSTAPLASLLAPGSSGTKKAYDKHHIFPDNFLKQTGRLANRSNRANFTLVDYGNNIYISDDDPKVYVAKFRERMGDDEYRRNCREHALPEGFEFMDYDEFLGCRRALMAQLIRDAFRTL